MPGFLLLGCRLLGGAGKKSGIAVIHRLAIVARDKCHIVGG